MTSLILLSIPLLAQSALQHQIALIAQDAHGKVSVACSLPGSALNCDLNPHAHPPMQSVFKLPLTLTVLHLVEQGKWTLDQPVHFAASDRIPTTTASPLQDKYPKGEVDVPLRELLKLAVSESDNVAADILLRIAGGPQVVEDYLASLGVGGFRLQDGEAAMHRDVQLQYRNWFEPAGAVQLLRRLADDPPLNRAHNALLLQWLRETTRSAMRIKGQLPAGTVVMHKSGSSDTDNGLTHAWNDIGLIELPGGRRLAVAVFITDSLADDANRDRVIARIAKAAYEEAVRR